MSRIVNDSDDEYGLESLSQEHEEEEWTATKAPLDGAQDDRTQSTGSTEKVLREAYANIVDAVTPENDRAVTRTVSAKGDEKESSSTNLKRARSVGVGSEDEDQRKRRKKECRRDDWDIPLSSSPSKDPPEQREDVMVIVDQGSTIMDNVSSAERRARELATSTSSTNMSRTRTPTHADPNYFGQSVSEMETTAEDIIVIGENRLPSTEPAGTARKDGTGRTSMQEEAMEHNDIDELASSIPNELYRPRSTKSRQHRVNTSGVPEGNPAENKQSARAKRRKKSYVVREGDRTVLTDMGFEASQAERALKEMDGNVQRATDWLLSGGDHKENPYSNEDEVTANDAPTIRGRGRPRKKQAMEDEEEEEPAVLTREHNSTLTLATNERCGQWDVNAKLDNNEPKADTADLSEIGKNRKKGRGRPKRRPKEPDVAPLESGDKKESQEEKKLEASEAGTAETDKGRERQDERAEADVDADSDATATATREENEKASNAQQPLQPEKPQGADAGGQDLEQTSVKAGKRASPIKNGKVPFRVGLSKRLKIPSLLSSAKRAP